MKFLTCLMLLLALCCSTRCWSMYGGYYGRPGAPVGRPIAPAAGAKVLTQQEYQAYLAQQAQQRAGGAAPAAAQPQVQQPTPAAPAAQPQIPARKPKIRFSNAPTIKTGEKYAGEIEQEETAAASVTPVEGEDETELARRKRRAIEKSKWSGVNDEAAALEELRKEQNEGTSDIPKGMTKKEVNEERKRRMKELGIPLEKAPGSFW